MQGKEGLSDMFCTQLTCKGSHDFVSCYRRSYNKVIWKWRESRLDRKRQEKESLSVCVFVLEHHCFCQRKPISSMLNIRFMQVEFVGESPYAYCVFVEDFVKDFGTLWAQLISSTGERELILSLHAIHCCFAVIVMRFGNLNYFGLLNNYK